MDTRKLRTGRDDESSDGAVRAQYQLWKESEVFTREYGI
jgi:hypothetical protein